MPILNYTTRVPAEQTVLEIARLLVRHGATDIITSYGEDGEPRGLKWRLNNPPRAFGLCAALQRPPGISLAHPGQNSGSRRRGTPAASHPRGLAHLALLDTGMVELEEIFLPYMLQSDQTLYHALRAGNFKALQSG